MSALLRNAEEVVEEGPPHLEGQHVQNSVEANPPGPLGLVLENESLVATELQWFAAVLLLQTAFLLDGQLGGPNSRQSCSVTAWCSQMVTASTCSSALSSWSSGTDEGEHNVWNPFFGFCCHRRIGCYMDGILAEGGLGRVALSCRFALHFLCDKSELQAVTFEVTLMCTARGSEPQGGMVSWHEGPWRVGQHLSSAESCFIRGICEALFRQRTSASVRGVVCARCLFLSSGGVDLHPHL